MNIPHPPIARPSRPTASTIGLAVLLASIMVGVAILGWFLSPASAEATEPGHLSGLCEALMDQQIAHFSQAAYGEWQAYLVPEGETDQDRLERAKAYVDNPEGAEESYYAGLAAQRLYVLEEC